MEYVLHVRVGVGDEVLSEQTVQLTHITPVFTHRTVSTLPDRDGNQLSPEVAKTIQDAIAELSKKLMERGVLGKLLAEPSYRKTSAGYKLDEVSFVPKAGC